MSSLLTARVAAVLPSLPMLDLRTLQAGKCAGCPQPLPTADLRARTNDGTILGLVCKSCSIRRALLREPVPYVRLDSLARLRLRLPHHLGFRRVVSARDRRALASADWDHFESPTHALWVYQRGRCPLPWHAGWSLDWATASLVLDHDHESGLARALLCQRCNTTEGKARRGQRMPLLTTYRLGSPAQACPATAGLSYNYLRLSGRP